MPNNVIYLSLDINFQSCASIEARILMIDQILDSLYNSAMVAILAGNRVEYTIDTGQTKQNVIVSDGEAINRMIIMYENMRTRYQFKLTGRVFRDIDGSNLNGRWRGF